MAESDSIEQMARRAKKTAIKLANLATTEKNRLLLALSERIKEAGNRIASENARDVQEAEKLVSLGELSKPLLKRLILTPDKLEQLSVYLEEVAKLPDPIGNKQFAMKLAEDLVLERISCPIGLVAVIFESRPEVVIQVSALSLKSGNAVILKGGREARNSNRVLYELISDVLADFGLENSVNLIETRDDVAGLLEFDDYVDLIIPRGSNEFVKYIQDNTKIPVLGHSSGICHIYLDKDMKKETALPVIIDAKLDYPSACNALETLLIHKDVEDDLLLDLFRTLLEKGVELRVCQTVYNRFRENFPQLKEADDQDWSTEYTDLILSVKVVNDTEEAVEHINQYSSHHTDAIITENPEAADCFFKHVDSACVFHNASTRFSDGYVFGLGAEVGISTNKTHSRGPVGLEGMTIYKYLLRGNGQLRATFSGKEAAPFLHQPIIT